VDIALRSTRVQSRKVQLLRTSCIAGLNASKTAPRTGLHPSPRWGSRNDPLQRNVLDPPVQKFTKPRRPRIPVLFKLLVVFLNAPQVARLRGLRRSNQFALNRAGVGRITKADRLVLSLLWHIAAIIGTRSRHGTRFNLRFTLFSCRALWASPRSNFCCLEVGPFCSTVAP
jgi:hypothetical protein